MASLVADYSDSSTDDNTYSDSDSIIGRKEELKDVKETETEACNFLFTTTKEDSDYDDSNGEDLDNSPESESNKKTTEKLPNPLLGDVQTSSVFINPFKQAELDKQSVLEKHVQMTEKRNLSNKKVCFKFKKGKCYKGKSCRFLHDIDTVRGTVYNSSEDSSNHIPGAAMQRFIEEPVDDDNYLLNAKRKKRHGVSDHLIPPKKALLSLEEQRSKERPWTMKKKKN
ncbi:uncharacterized protein LOC126825594 [Patella vulgata]|uniref:uncharacterized protein LOC126825594 n=1 Tax=Patella vulgata TaxID=6465 RepID=UPI00217FA9BD|nr:uncharacterized protein LOC126825594 [Patella vulgata]